jgi:hypothetical protein
LTAAELSACKKWENKMENYVIATNSDNRIEAFYIEEGVVKHAWQKTAENATQWTEAIDLYSMNGGAGNGQPLTNATRIEACTNTDGQIHVVAFTTEGKYFTAYQTPGAWNGWLEIIQS